MSRDIKEADWGLLRKVVPVALERFCQRILEEIAYSSSETTKNYHQRYLDIFALLQRRDKDLEYAFNDLRRSTALARLATICSYELLTEEEFLRFSPETRDVIDLFLSRGRV
jgi:beta-galactosidase beta subunit